MKFRRIILLSVISFLSLSAFAANSVNDSVTKVLVVFKTHLDVGFTDFSSVVEKRYMTEFIPKALDVSEKLNADGTSERYIWTTGSWLVWNYLKSASPEDVARLESAIRRGDIVWNAVPYTVETESMNADLLETNLQIAKLLDKKYGKKTIAAKMTDVPGHTRSIVEPLVRNGITFLHVGVNPASPLPAVPPFCRWRDPDGNEIILAYQQDYGTESILPDGKTAISINFTGDNHGPHSYEAVKDIYASLRSRYPNAEIIASSFNEIADELETYRDYLPLVTSEIGDTWIHGYGSAPIRMAKFRALNRLYSDWLREGKINRDDEASLSFALQLGLIAEHTQGMDIKTHLVNWDKYDTDKFLEARTAPPFRKVEESWHEINEYICKSIDYLPDTLKAEAHRTVAAIDRVQVSPLVDYIQPTDKKEFSTILLSCGNIRIAGISYQMLDTSDYNSFFDNYLRARYGWAIDDFGKTGLDKSGAVSISLPAIITATHSVREKNGTRTVSELRFSDAPGIDNRVYPRRIVINIFTHDNGREAEVELTVIGKPAVRLPEAYWISFNADDIAGIVAEKTGKRVSLLDVIERGNRQMHGIDRYIDLITSRGTVRIWSDDAFLVNIGEPRGLNYSTHYPDKAGGIHFNLSNNLWGTNFAMWNEGSLTYRFRIELI